MGVTKVFGLQARQEGWVIAGRDVVWCGRSVHDFRKDWQEAVRFVRPADAHMVLHWILPEEYRRVCDAVHHTWEPSYA